MPKILLAETNTIGWKGTSDSTPDRPRYFVFIPDGLDDLACCCVCRKSVADKEYTCVEFDHFGVSLIFVTCSPEHGYQLKTFFDDCGALTQSYFRVTVEAIIAEARSQN